MILDTSFLIDVLRGEDEVVEWEDTLDERGIARVTSISVMELWEGVHLVSVSEQERNRVQALLDGLTHAEFDHESAMLAGEINATLTHRGNVIDVEDVMIGAIALRLDEPVLTRDSSHFERIDGLTIEVY